MLDYHVYVLYFKTDKQFYIGYTCDVQRRLREHLSGNVQSTNKRGDFDLLLLESYSEQGDATRREKYLKTTKGKHTLRKMLAIALKVKYSEIV